LRKAQAIPKPHDIPEVQAPPSTTSTAGRRRAAGRRPALVRVDRRRARHRRVGRPLPRAAPREGRDPAGGRHRRSAQDRLRPDGDGRRAGAARGDRATCARRSANSRRPATSPRSRGSTTCSSSWSAATRRTSSSCSPQGLHAVDGVVRTESFLILEIHKMAYGWGVGDHGVPLADDPPNGSSRNRTHAERPRAPRETAERTRFDRAPARPARYTPGPSVRGGPPREHVPVHARERLRADQQLHRHRQRAARAGPPVVFAAERSWAGKLEALGFEEDLVDLAAPPDDDGRRRAGRRAVLDRLHPRDLAGVPAADDRAALEFVSPRGRR
jgi:hypothetical protein